MPKFALAGGIQPLITVQPVSQTVSVSGTVTFSVQCISLSTVSYQWYFGGNIIDGATANSVTLNNVQSSEAGSYYVKLSNASQITTTSSSATLTVNVPPSIQQQPANQTVTQGGAATFSVTASGTGPLNYQWSLNGSSISRATSSTLSLTDVQSSQAGTYTVYVSGAAGSVTSQGATLTVNIPPAITTQPQSQSVATGQSPSFSVAATGTGSLTYQWYLNGSQLGAGNNSTLSLNNVTTNNAGSYTVVVQNNYGSVTSSVATLFVYSLPAISIQPQSQSILEGQDVSFSVAATGTPTLSYQWYINGSSVNGSKGRQTNYTVSSVSLSDEASYTVVVQNSYGAVTSAVATLTVDLPPSITTQPTSQSVVKGNTVSFSVGASGTPLLAYQWNLNGSPLACATNASLTVTNSRTTNAGSYDVVVTNNFGSVTSAVVTLTVDFPPSIKVQPQSQNVSLLQNASFSVTAGGTGALKYQWYDGGIPVGLNSSNLTLYLVTALNAGNYTVVVNNNYGSVTSAVVTLTVTNPPIVLAAPILQSLKTSGFTFQLSVPTGITYVIMASTNLQTWTPILTNVATSSTAAFTDSMASNYPGRFYRVVQR